MLKVSNIKFAAILFLCTLVFFSCRRRAANDITVEGPPQVLTATVADTLDWTGLEMTATIINNSITIIGKAQNLSTMTLFVKAASEGNYALGQSSQHAAAYSPEPGPIIYFSKASPMTGGQIQITEINTVDSLIAGTFQLNLMETSENESVLVTDGVFEDLKYITAPPSQNGEMFANLDSIPWVAASINGTINTFSDKLIIEATDATGFQAIEIHLPETVTPGVYSLGNPSFATYGAAYSPGGFNSIRLISETGTVKINVHNPNTKQISGTCSFKAVDSGVSPETANITNASFVLDYNE